MAPENETTKPSEPHKVDAYMRKMQHPLKNVVEALRQLILSTDPEIGEEIKWNARRFFIPAKCAPLIQRSTKDI